MRNCDLWLDFGLCCLVLCFGLGFGVGVLVVSFYGGFARIAVLLA